MNLNVSPKSGQIGWRVNLDTIHKAFETDIINFPYDEFECRVSFDRPALFIGGANSEYLPGSILLISVSDKFFILEF
jgi:hypothetical protein